MDIILVPGLWLGGWSWWQVAPELEKAGHRPVPLTLPGMESPESDRTGVTLTDQVAAVVAAIDAAPEPVVLVGHSAGCGIVYAAADARPERVARLILVAGFPAQNGEPLLSGFTAVDGEIPLPPWDEFDDADRRDLGDMGETALREHAIPAPGRVVTDIVRLGDDRRLDIPVTAIATEYSAADLQEWIAAGAPPVQEFTRIRDVTYVDVPTGHWPMLTRPLELARAILAQPPLGDGTIDRGPLLISAKRFHEAEGVEDWRVLYWGAHACYRTQSFAEGARFITAISEIADELAHHPDVDLRPEAVVVRTFSRRDGALSDVDAELARRISAAAHSAGLEPDPSALQMVGLAIAEAPGVDVRPFWSAAFGYEYLGAEDSIDPLRRGPHLWFHEIDPPNPGRGRMHVDVSVPRDQVESRVAAALAAGGRMADDSHAPEWWTLASPENHGVDIAGWTDDSAEEPPAG